MIQGRRPTEKTRGFPGDFCENVRDNHFDKNAKRKKKEKKRKKGKKRKKKEKKVKKKKSTFFSGAHLLESMFEQGFL